MNDRQILPFERNRYYTGKMLTSSDFRTEQGYMNHKRRFFNHMVLGEGIVCGCSVFSLDDLSILVESGVAIDGLGREVVLESAVVQKLSAIKGFEELTKDTASLCLRYREEEVQSVYSVHQQEGAKEYEYNHIREGYELYLVDAVQSGREFRMESEFLTEGELFRCADYRISVIMPAAVCSGQEVRLTVRVEKLTDEDRELSYSAILQLPAFLAQENGQQLELAVEKQRLNRGGFIEKCYWLKVLDTEVSDTDIILKGGSVEAAIDEEKVEWDGGFTLRIAVTAIGPEELVTKEIGKLNLEMQNMTEARDYIHLADLKLTRTESAYLIEEIVEKGIKHYLYLPVQEKRRREYLAWFRNPAQEMKERQGPAQKSRQSGEGQDWRRLPAIKSGILEIPLGDRTKKGEIYYSGEIMHGLGKGNVAVQIGYEYLEEGRADGANIRNTVYGSHALFGGDRSFVPDVETAVKVLNDKGSFIAAVKLRGAVNALVLSFRWTAVRYPADAEDGLGEENVLQGIAAQTPTVVLGTRESYYFAVRFTNMESCSLGYELTESGSGEISADGVYTAPGRPGVYEIHIYCTDKPFVNTYAYAIVKNKLPFRENMIQKKETPEKIGPGEEGHGI